ncbi:hypothetical protein LJK87_49175 [Paenibacillus sp. P25]|nr:hypothetical protein LJK87_49175 [Paenibacillus sp. P25]
MSAAETKFRYPEAIEVRGYSPSPRVDEGQIQALAYALKIAKRPLILSGAGVIHADASEELIGLAEDQQIPVTATLLGLGGFPGGHPLWLGMPGMHGTYAANRAMLDCDLLISVGARFDDRVTMRLDGFAPQAAIAHIDIDAAEIGKLVRTVLPVTGDAKEVLKRLRSSTGRQRVDRSSWLDHAARIKALHPLGYTPRIKPLSRSM